MIDQAVSFPPIEGDQAHTLILGTMPGQASLGAQQYYAHARNAFWPIMLAIIDKQAPSFETPKTMGYDDRCQHLRLHGYAIWDVLASCERPGSLDSNIVKTTEQANDIAGLVGRHPELQRIICNGKTAQQLFKRHVQGQLPRASILLDEPTTQTTNDIRVYCLPSSSPAMASLTLAQKHQRWAEGLLG